MFLILALVCHPEIHEGIELGLVPGYRPGFGRLQPPLSLHCPINPDNLWRWTETRGQVHEILIGADHGGELRFRAQSKMNGSDAPTRS